MRHEEGARERTREMVPVTRPTMQAKQEEPGTNISGKIGTTLVEFSTETQQDVNDGISFGDAPVHCNCPHCERAVVTFTDYESSWVTYLLAFVVWFSLGWMAFWVLPLLWPAFKDVVHHCPRCLNVIARKSRISLPTFRTEVMSLKVGSCAIVLARKYVIILGGLLAIILTGYILRSTLHFKMQNTGDSLPKGDMSLLTWDDFLRECGPRTAFGHRTSSVRNFEEHFRRKTFRWQGEVLLIREGFDVFFLHAKSVIMVRMHPQRYLHQQDLPDVALLFSDDKNSEVAPLNKGDWIEFEATMTAHGHRGDPEVMMLWDVKKATKPDIPSSSAGSHGSGRHGGHAFAQEESRESAESNSRRKEVPPATPAPTPAPPVAAQPAATLAPVATMAPAAPAAPVATTLAPLPPSAASGENSPSSTPAPMKEETKQSNADSAADAVRDASKASDEKTTDEKAAAK